MALPGGEGDAIREAFDMSPTRYYQVLGAVLEKPGAIAHNPMLVKRLLRLRANRAAVRVAGRALQA